jgi:hypothetical protein
MDSLMALTDSTTVANVVMLLALLYPALRNFSKTRSSIAGALMLFILVFLFQNIAAIYFHFTLMYTPSVELEMVVLTVLQTVSFGTLLWVTYK